MSVLRLTTGNCWGLEDDAVTLNFFGREFERGSKRLHIEVNFKLNNNESGETELERVF